MGLRKASRALARLHVSLDTKIHFMERTVSPAVLHHGIHSLPNEALLHILRICLDEVESADRNMEQCRRDLQKLALVNKRFQALISTLPSMWSDHHFYAKKGRPGSIIGRSFNSGLHVYARSQAGVDSALKYAERWTSYSDKSLDDTSLNWTKSNVAFPALRSVDTQCIDGELQKHLFPALRRLRIGRLVHQLDLIPAMPQLTELAISYELGESQDVSNLVSSLALCENLRRLELSCCTSGPFESDQHLRSICLHRLEEFILICSTRSITRTGTIETCRLLVMPKLQSLRLVFRDNIIDSSYFRLDKAFPPDRDYSGVQYLEFDVFAELSPNMWWTCFIGFPKLIH